MPIIAAAIAVGVFVIYFEGEYTPQVVSSNTVESSDIESQSMVPDSTGLIVMETNGVKHTIPLDKIKGGGPPKDGIPSIDDPVFAEVQDLLYV